VCLTIGTLDCSGGAGIGADLKTFTALGCYGAAVLTAATAQNSTGIRALHVVPTAFVRNQLDAITDEMTLAAVKVGLCPAAATIRAVGRWLRERPALRVVVDPVCANSRGIPLLQPEAVAALKQELLPRATVITPNRFQAAQLTGAEECLGEEAVEEAARAIFATFGCPTVISGGDLMDSSRDVFVGIDGLHHFEGHDHAHAKVHGSGSTFSAAITAGMARGEGLRESILAAKLYLASAVAGAPPPLPSGNRLLWHGSLAEPLAQG